MTDQQFFSVLSQAMPDFTPVEKIGAGNYGSVFKCERDGMYSAIKIIPVPANDEELQMLLSRSAPDVVREYLKSKVENYRREIRIMSEVLGSSCNIVTLQNYKIIPALDAPVSDDTPLGYHIVICMELLTSLTSHLAKHKLTRAEIITLGIDICSALMTCEKHNIVHRDIKPENILIHNDGVYKLGDFGVAKELSKTTVGTIAGTELYMAPEVSKGMEYNHTADIYSLGIVLYTLLNNGKVPYVKPDDKSLVAEQEAIVKRMNTDEILPFPPEADETLGNIVLKACMYKKEQRYQSAEIMQTDLIMALHGRKVEVDLTESAGLGVEYGKGTTSDKDQSPFSKSMMRQSVSEKDENKKNTDEIPQRSKKTSTKRNHLKAKIIAATSTVAVIGLAAGGFALYHYIQNEPTSYVDASGNTVQTISRNEMETAYELGVQYYEQGNYENAIAELNKVTNKSSVYEEAQMKMAEAMTAYRNKLIEKSSSYSESGDYETALSLVESGTALIGEDVELIAQEQNILNTLKLDHINRSAAAEEKEDYAEAFSHIQTASAFLPDDIELKSLYTRLDAMSKAATALNDASRYKAAEDYPKLFSSLEEAMDNVADSNVALSKLTLAFDEYKTTYLDEINQKIKNPTSVDEYTRAIESLDVAVSIFTDEYELKQKQEELKLMKIALTALKTAEDQKRQQKFKEMFETLKKAEEEVYGNAEAKEKITVTCEAYKTEYLENLYTRIGVPTTVLEYSGAVTILAEAIEVFPNENDLITLYEDYSKKTKVELFSLNYISRQRYGGYWVEAKNDIPDGLFKINTITTSDSYGNQYENPTLFLNAGDTCDANLTYDIEGYGKLEGTVALYNPTRGSNFIVTFGLNAKLKNGDWEHRVVHIKFDSSTKPQYIEFNLEEYEQICIYFQTLNSKGDRITDFDYTLGVILSDFILSIH